LPVIRRFKLGRRAIAAVEFAIVGPVFIIFLFVVFEITYGLFLQSVLDNTLQKAARMVQTGNYGTQPNGNPYANNMPTTEAGFVQDFICPSTGGIINCNSIYIGVQAFNDSLTNMNSCLGTYDLYDITSGQLPIDSNKTLQLGFYGGPGSSISPASNDPKLAQACVTNGSFCFGAPNETIVLTAIYVGPSFLQGLLPNNYKIAGGGYVRAEMSTTALETENYTQTLTTQAKGQSVPQC